MARPITLTAPLHEPSHDRVGMPESASQDHAEARLDGYELLQQLHNNGVFEALRGALAAGDHLTSAASGALNSPEAIAAMRNVMVMGKALAGIDPEVMRRIAGAMDETMNASTGTGEPPSLLTLLSHFRQPDVRRGIALVNRFLAELGRATSGAPAEKRIGPG